MCARAKALPSAGCALPPAEGLFPSGPPALTTRPSPYLGRSSPGELIRPPFRPSRLQLPRPHLKSLVAIVYWLAGGRHATRLSRRHSAPPLSAIMWRACARSFGWGGAEGKGLCSARAVERRGHPDLWGSILEAFITSDFRPGCWRRSESPALWRLRWRMTSSRQTWIGALKIETDPGIACRCAPVLAALALGGAPLWQTSSQHAAHQLRADVRDGLPRENAVEFCKLIQGRNSKWQPDPVPNIYWGDLQPTAAYPQDRH